MNKVDQLPSEHGNHMVMLRVSQAFVDDEAQDELDLAGLDLSGFSARDQFGLGDQKDKLL